MDKMLIWASVIGAIIIAALVAFFNTIFRMPMNNKERIDKMEVKLEFAISAIEKEQKMNKESHKEILSILTNLQKQINKISIAMARIEESENKNNN